jgi:hypothetical protein
MASQNSEVERRTASSSEGVVDWITLEEVDALIRKASGEPNTDTEGFLTSLEWSQLWGIHERTAQRKLAVLKRAGKAEVCQVTRYNVLNHPYKCPGYRVTP